MIWARDDNNKYSLYFTPDLLSKLSVKLKSRGGGGEGGGDRPPVPMPTVVYVMYYSCTLMASPLIDHLICNREYSSSTYLNGLHCGYATCA